jgi:siroheme synthase-like protein
MADSSLIPIWLNWSGRIVLVVGLGTVGQRRALMFQKAGATVIGLDPMPQIRGPAWGELIRNGLELRSEPYQTELFEELSQINSVPSLVLACATENVNQRVVHDARSRSIWVASATSAGEHVSMAIHSGNAAPALASTLRTNFEEQLLTPADELAKAALKWRTEILNRVADTHERRRLLSLFGDRSILELETNSPGQGVAKIESILQLALDSMPPEPKLEPE